MRLIIITMSFLLIAACSRELVKQPTGSGEIVTHQYPLAYVIKENVNMRQAGSANAELLETLKDGDKVFIIENVNGWYHIETENRHRGYVRSDLIGPRELCKTALARAFSDSVMPAFGGELFIDKNEPFRIIYITLPEKYYQSSAQAISQARKIGEAYQHKVYAGNIEIRILQHEGKELFDKIPLAAIGLGDLPAPILDNGRLVSLRQENRALTLSIAQDKSVDKKLFLNNARHISRLYGQPIQKIEIHFIDDSGKCLFYYLEDKDGELYREGC